VRFLHRAGRYSCRFVLTSARPARFSPTGNICFHNAVCKDHISGLTVQVANQTDGTQTLRLCTKCHRLHELASFKVRVGENNEGLEDPCMMPLTSPRPPPTRENSGRAG
jgi:hypothetical protein